MFRLLLILVFPLVSQAALSTEALNQLYARQAELREELDSLRSQPQPAGCVPTERPQLVVDKKTTVRLAPANRKHKLAAGTRWTLVARHADALVVTQGSDTLAIRSGSKLVDDGTERLLAWRTDSLECQVSAVRARNAWRQRLDLKEREVAEANGLETLYRRPGTHQKVSPAQMINGKVLPDWQDSLLTLDWVCPDTLNAAAWPWGPVTRVTPSADGLPAVLRFAGLTDEWITFRRLDTGDSLYCHTEEAARRFAAGESAELQAWSVLAAERTREAKRYRLLQKWEPALVEQILTGLVWKGMNREMLDESLGPPSRETVQEKIVVREYSRGSQVTLTDGRVTHVEQAPRQ
jgi:hypothetical protein